MKFMPFDTANGFLVKAAFVSVILGYAALLVIAPNFGPNDDFAFLRTLQSGNWFPLYTKTFPFYNDAALGRFNPIVAQEYNFVAYFSRTPFAYYLFNAIQFLTFSFLLYSAFKKAGAVTSFAMAFVVLFCFFPGSTTVWFRLNLGERGAAFFSLCFLFFYHTYFRSPKPGTFFGTIISATVALYFKEPTFLAVGTFALVRLALGFLNHKKETRILDGSLLLSAAIYPLIYFFYVFPDRGATLYGDSSINSFLLLSKLFLNFALVTDPLVIWLAFPLATFRSYKILLRWENAHAFYDPSLMAGIAYALAFFILRMQSPYYYFPVYVFVLPPLVYFLRAEVISSKLWRTMMIGAAAVLVGNALPLGLYYLSFHKYVPYNFNKMTEFLVSYIRANSINSRANIFLDGVDADRGRMNYFVLGEFLQYKGLHQNQFDLRSKEPRSSVSSFFIVDPYPRYTRTYSIFNNVRAPIESGDYLIISPAGAFTPDAAYYDGLKRDYRLLFRTYSPLAIPRLTVKSLAKRILLTALPPDQRNKFQILDENFDSGPDYFVFIRK